MNRKPRIIVVNGMARAGKSVVGDYIANICDMCEQRSSIDMVKHAAKALGWDGTKDERSRKFLSDIKQLTINYNDSITTDIVERYHKLCRENIIENGPNLQYNKAALVVDVREPKEIDKLKNMFEPGIVQTIFVDNGRVEDITSNESDKNVRKYKYDFIILNNSSLGNLYQAVNTVCDRLFEPIPADKIPNMIYMPMLHAKTLGCETRFEWVEQGKVKTVGGVFRLSVSYNAFVMDITESPAMLDGIEHCYEKMITNKINDFVGGLK